MTVEITVNPLREQNHASDVSAPSITNRFLFVKVAAMRAKQLHRGAKPRLDANHVAAPLVDDQRGQCFALEVLRDDKKRLRTARSSRGSTGGPAAAWAKKGFVEMDRGVKKGNARRQASA